MNRKKRFLALLISILLFIASLCIPYAVGYQGESISFLDRMIPQENDGYTNPLFPFVFFIPTLILATSFYWKTPFKIGHKLFFLACFLGACFSFFLVGILGMSWGSGTKYLPFLDIASLIGLIFLFWPLTLAIPFTSKWKWISWPFDHEKKDA
ncbi:MAG: hypothetical protein ACRCYO_17955 [Bacteroidia bacterium]